MSYKRWDVVAVAYPFIEGDTVKHRPALVVSADGLERIHRVYWVVMITTAKAGVRAEDIHITDHAKAGLPENCVIRVCRLTTLSDAQISRRVGSITVKDRNAVSALLKKYLP